MDQVPVTLITPPAPTIVTVPCPCGSGRLFPDCHGVGSPSVPAPLVAAVPVPQRMLDLACGQNPREGYEGVDQWPGAKHVVNLTKYPWPFEDNSVHRLHCSHYIEHIAMEFVDDFGNPVREGGTEALLKFFDECWRILVPDGWMTVIAPNARNDRGFWDPTHRRFIVAQTFAYLNADWRALNKLDHYQVKCNFRGGANPTVRAELTLRHAEAAARMMTHEWNQIEDWVAEIQAVKPKAA